MKVCVCSDSHGHYGNMQNILEKEIPDVLLFLGDGVRDAEDCAQVFSLPCQLVAGNCDLASHLYELTKEVRLGGKRLLLTHGHRFYVKSGLSLLRQQAEGYDAVLYGHTHVQSLEVVQGCNLLNPGSVMQGKYALLHIDAGDLQCELKQL